MSQVIAERDMLRLRLLQQAQPLARSSTASADWIAAAYGTNSRPAQPLSGERVPLKSSIITTEAFFGSHCGNWVGIGCAFLHSLDQHPVVGTQGCLRHCTSSIRQSTMALCKSFVSSNSRCQEGHFCILHNYGKSKCLLRLWYHRVIAHAELVLYKEDVVRQVVNAAQTFVFINFRGGLALRLLTTCT